jgi:Uma2 family endonuclease
MVTRDRLITADEFEQIAALPENSDRLLELIDGEVVEKVPTEEHSLIVGNLYVQLRTFAESRDLGRVAFEVRRKAPDDPINTLLPDAEFTRKERLLPVVRKGAVPQMPDLAIEVKSPDDSFLKLREKALYYLKHGSRLVWLIFPERQQVEVHTADGPILTLGADQTLDGGEALAGFSLPVADIFKGV